MLKFCDHEFLSSINFLLFENQKFCKTKPCFFFLYNLFQQHKLIFSWETICVRFVTFQRVWQLKIYNKVSFLSMGINDILVAHTNFA